MIGAIKDWLARKRYAAARKCAEEFNAAVDAWRSFYSGYTNPQHPHFIVNTPNTRKDQVKAIYLGCANVWKIPQGKWF